MNIKKSYIFVLKKNENPFYSNGNSGDSVGDNNISKRLHITSSTVPLKSVMASGHNHLW